MARVVVPEDVEEGSLSPIHIVTEMGDIDFIQSVLREWAQYDEDEIEKLMKDYEEMGEIDEMTLTSIGVLVQDKGHPNISLYLVKIGEGKWIVPGMDIDELEELAEAVEGNLH